MQSPDRVARFVERDMRLDQSQAYSVVMKLLLRIAAREEAALVPKYFRLDNERPREFRFSKLDCHFFRSAMALP